MAALQNFGTIKTQQFLDEFVWNKKHFYSYLIAFNEFDGYFRIIRQSEHEQALIGGQMIFNYSEEEQKITKYRIVCFKPQEQKKRDRVKELLEKRKQRK